MRVLFQASILSALLSDLCNTGGGNRLRSLQYSFSTAWFLKKLIWLPLSGHLAQAHGAPAWLQPTYELDSELAAFIGDFQERERVGADNLWILKPWNMARSIDSSVTRNLVQVIR